ncbi:Alpha/Beta hydrolase protein [Hyaloraphidium curvatum]|nr:Alpha/Beta hydrolase protein [Hyaloraphidium curvatum]
MLREAQDKLGGEKLRKGYYNPELRCSRLTMDNIKALPRPWAVYLFTHMASYFHHLALRWLYGFDYRTFSDVPYLIRDPKPTASVDGGKDSKSGAAADDPIVFVHGIGIGSPPYHHFLDSLIRRFPNRKIAVILLPHVSMRIHHRVPSRGEWIDAVGGILRREGISRAAWVAHSLGTTCFAWVAKHRPEWVSSAVLIDPVCFALWDGNVADNFVYSDRFGSLADRIVRFMAGRELFAAHALARHFIWHENQLLASHLGDLKAGVRAFVAEKDAIADPTRCEAWCRKHGIDVTVMPGLGHAGWLFKGDWTTKVIDAI